MPNVLLIAAGIGVALAGSFKVEMLNQIIAVMKRAVFTGISATDAINNLIIIIGVATTIILFSFTREHKGPVGVATRIGRIILMITLGARAPANVRL